MNLFNRYELIKFHYISVSMKPCKVFTSISPIYYSEGDKIFRDFDRLSVEPVTLSKYVAEYEQMWTWMVEFLSKFQGRGINIDRVNSIHVSKSMIFFSNLRAIAV